MNLYSFENNASGIADQGAPRLIPAGSITGSGGGFLAKDSTSFKKIDVINDFQWTTSPKTSREKDVPKIILKEKRLKNNALYAQVAYYSMALGQAGYGALGNIAALPDGIGKSLVTGVVGAFAGGKLAELGQQIANFTGINLGQAANSLITTTSQIGGGILGLTKFSPEKIEEGLNTLFGVLQLGGKDLPDQFNFDSLNSNVLRPYEGLYITEDTKFVYNFPYFSDSQNYISNMFGDYDDVLGLGGLDPIGAAELAAGTRAAATMVTGTVNFDAPGIYIEKPKFFNFKETGEQIRFSIPLINTGWATFEDVKQNWQLMYMLAYQNRPNRRTRNLIDPAVIYEITIPGIRYYPYAYISEMSVNFVGARRRMNINVPAVGGSKSINTIIPDAYVLDITLTTLVSETQNFLYAMLHDKQDIITTSSQMNPFEKMQEEGRLAFESERLRNLDPASRSGFNALIQGGGDLIKNFSSGGTP